MTEKELIIGLKKSSTAAYRQLFARYYTIILRFLVKMLGDEPRAKDIAQNIFLKIWLVREKLDESKSVKTYLYVLAKNEAINNIKYESRTKQFDESFQMEDSSGVQEEVNFRETEDIIRSCVENMPLQRRNVFKMSRVEDMSNKEISQMLNISVRTVEKHIELALKDLKKAINS